MGMVSPVLGLRPGRGGLSRTWKLPNPESFTESPRASVADLFEEGVDDVLGLALVQADPLEEQLGQFSLVRVRGSASIVFPMFKRGVAHRVR